MPLRTCLGCRTACEQQTLVRYVLSPDGELLVDYRSRLPGRGAYTCADVGCLEAAVKRRQFQRALKSPSLHVEAGQLRLALSAGIEQKIVNLLGMARKSGVVISGSNMVLDALASAVPPVVVVLARDVSAGIGDKVVASARARGALTFRMLDKAVLGQLLGKEERSVVALRGCPIAESVKAEMLRYMQIAGEI